MIGVMPDTEAVWEKDGKWVGYVEGARPWIRQTDEPWTLADALNNVQSVLVAWLRGLGYEVQIA